MLNAAIDIGNTRTKIGFFKATDLLDTYVVSSEQELITLLSGKKVNRAIVSAVGKELLLSQATGIEVLYLDHQTKVPISNNYNTPETLGMDRLAVAVGAHALDKDSPSLIIDAGTSITYDLIDQNGCYQGGGIAPGIKLRFRCLNDYTTKLPLIEENPLETPLIGKTTEESIKSGVLNGVTSEIDGIIGRYHQKFPNLKVLLCGGDATFFESNLKAPIFVVPHLVLMGLNRILLHNA